MPKIEWRWPWEKPKTEPIVRPPKVGGTRAPSHVETIDFTKPHDFHFRMGYDREKGMVFENCLLIGFTTPMSNDTSYSEWEERTHNRWIVLQRPDGRRVYIPRDNLSYIEDSLVNDPYGPNLQNSIDTMDQNVG